ncbi:MAG: hypothetical protein JRH16_04985 [Deltaproteobacteria bacterium]|nr:hypothetical protein [Deltaproteobacteria bacterium]MBW2361632.1 hypothetical protein [Deltaproteobacteria bacterium]
MKRVVVFCLALSLAFGLAASAADDRPQEMPYVTDDSGIPQLSPEYRMTSHKVVLITDQALNPRLVKLDEGQLVAWISYSATESVVVFEREVARDMVCHSLVNFSLQEDELRSAPIRAGEFASFCQLKPGRYRYKIVRPSAIERNDARHRLDGEILVGGAE